VAPVPPRINTFIGPTYDAGVASLFSTRVLLGPRAFARERELEPALLDACQLEASLCDDLDAWLPMDALSRGFAYLASATNDGAVGLRCADAVPPAAYDYLRFIGASSQDLGASFRHFEHLFPSLATESRAVLHEGPARVRLMLHVVGRPALDPRAADYVMACTLRGFQAVSATRLLPVQVELRHAGPEVGGAHEAFFGCRTHFAQAEDALVFDPEVMAYPTSRPDADLQKILLQYAGALTQRQPKSERAADRVERWVVQWLGKRPLSLQGAAKFLGVSQRSLQRQLQDEKAPFRDIVDGVRERLARSYLATSELGVGEVAGLLGYADARAFHRAFIGWTGTTPGRFRKSTA
jgi:AraC-like DNA-binding protein